MKILSRYRDTNSYQILALSLPILLSTSVSLILGVTDTIMIGRTNVEQLSAVSAGAALFSLISAMVAASLVSSKVLSAKYFGSKNLKAVYENMRYSFVFGMIIVLIAIFFMAILGRFILGFIIENKQVIEISYGYLMARSPGLIILIISSVIGDVLSSYKKTKWVMYSSIMSNVANVILGYIFIFGIGPIPRMEAIGAGLSSSLAQLVGLLFIYVAYNKENIFKGIDYREITFDTRKFWASQRMNFPQIGSAVFDYIANIMLFAIMGLLGTIFLAGGRIAFQLDMVIFTIAMSLGVGGNILIGRSWGEQNVQKMNSLIKSTIVILVISVTIVSLPLIIAPSIILSIFTNIEEVIEVTRGSLIIIGISAPFIAISSALAGTLRSFGKTDYDMYSNVLPIWFVQLPVSYLFGVVYNFGLSGIYVGFLFYWIIRSMMAAYYLKQTIKKVQGNITSANEDVVRHV